MAKCDQDNGTAHSPDLILVHGGSVAVYRCGKHQQAVQALADKLTTMSLYPLGQEFQRGGFPYVVTGHSAAGDPYVFNLATKEFEGVYK